MAVNDTKQPRAQAPKRFYKTEKYGLEVIEYGEEVPMSVLRHFFPYMNREIERRATRSKASKAS